LRRNVAKKNKAGKQGERDSEDAKTSDPAVPHDVENLIFPPAATEPVCGVCQRVFVETARDGSKEDENENDHNIVGNKAGGNMIQDDGSGAHQ
jgi:hypothetical protein